MVHSAGTLELLPVASAPVQAVGACPHASYRKTCCHQCWWTWIEPCVPSPALPRIPAVQAGVSRVRRPLFPVGQKKNTRQNKRFRGKCWATKTGNITGAGTDGGKTDLLILPCFPLRVSFRGVVSTLPLRLARFINLLCVQHTMRRGKHGLRASERPRPHLRFGLGGLLAKPRRPRGLCGIPCLLFTSF
jgi:hypothetical protein